MLFILAIGLTAWCRCHDMDFSNHSRVQFANFCFLLVQFSAFVGFFCTLSSCGCLYYCSTAGGPFSDSLLRDVTNALPMKSVKSPRRFSLWDLFLVL